MKFERGIKPNFGCVQPKISMPCVPVLGHLGEFQFDFCDSANFDKDFLSSEKYTNLITILKNVIDI